MMMKKSKIVTLALVGLVSPTLSGLAHAENFKSGVVLSALAGASFMRTKLDETYSAPAIRSGSASNSTSDTGFIGTFSAGYRYYFSNKVLAGVEAGVTGDTAKFSKTQTVGASGPLVTKLKAPARYQAALSVGTLLSDKWLALVKAGVSFAEFKGSQDDSGLVQKFRTHKTGLLLGAGVERALTEKIAAVGSFTWEHFDAVKRNYNPFPGLNASNTISLKPDYYAVQAGVRISL
jgi:opacity protein-like surface antigen